MLSGPRDAAAAKRLFRKARTDPSYPQPRVTKTGQARIYGSAISGVKKEGILHRRYRHRPVQYLNNILEQDHRAIKRRVKAKQGFREFHAARRTIQGYEAMHMIRKGCRSRERFGRELIAVDGTRIKAANRRDRNFTGAKRRRDLAASQERLERSLQQMDEMDAAEVADASPSQGQVRDLAQKIAALRERQARLETHRKALQESGEDPLSR